MRNGIYRVWYKGSAHGAAASLLVDGQFIGCNRTHNLLGRYQEQNGYFSATIEATRHTSGVTVPNNVELDTYRMRVEGLCTSEAVKARGTVEGMPGFALDIEYVWLSEV